MGFPALAPSRIEGALTGFDLRRGGSTAFTAQYMLGPNVADIDPLDTPDAGVLRRFLALASRGLMVERGGPRASSVVSDLGGVALALAVMDRVANPRSALRSARARLAKSGRLDNDDTARVRDVGGALRDLLGHAVSSATPNGSAGRDLAKETVLTPDVMDHLAVALARAVYDGFTPQDEHPLVVPGVGPQDHVTMAPILAASRDPDPGAAPALGLYNRIAFIALPYAQLADEELPAVSVEPRIPPRPTMLDESALTRVREVIRPSAPPPRSVANTRTALHAAIDLRDLQSTWRRSTVPDVAVKIVRTIEHSPPGLHVAIVIGPRTTTATELVDALGTAMTKEWHLLSPRATDRTLALERATGSGLQLRQADVSRWLDADAARSIQWDAAPGA